MQWLKASLGVAIAILLTSGDATAQTTGTISGHVSDTQQLGVPGVTITVEGPNLQGGLTVVSAENGDYVAPLLPAGPYTVTFTLAGFEKQERNVTLAVGQTLPVDATMGPASVSENVNVVGSTTSVLTQTAQVATNFKQDMIAMLPTNRSIDADVLRAPAVHPTGPGGNYSIAGAVSFESLYLVNGVTVNENLRGQANTLFIEDQIQETTISTSGISAEYGRFSGGVINVITKSGTNLFSGSFRDSLYNDNWRAYVTGNANFAPLAAGQLTPSCSPVSGLNGNQIPDPHCFAADGPTAGTGGTPTKIDAVVPQYEYVFGGPILKDRLTFITSGRFITQQTGLTTVQPVNLAYTAEDKRRRYEGKLTGTLTSNHRVEGTYTKETRDQLNNTFSTATSLDQASLYNRQLPQDYFTGNYRGILSPRLFLEARLTERHFSFIGSGSPYTDLINGTLLIDRARGNLRYWSPTFCGVCDPEKRDNDEELVKGTYFLTTRDGGSHDIIFGYNRYNDKRFANNHQSGSDYRILGTTTIIRGTGPDAVIYPQWLVGTAAGSNPTVLQYTPLLEGTEGTNFRTHSLFANDNWRIGSHLTANLGVRWDKNDGANGAGDKVVHDSAFSPRLGIVYDVKGDGVLTVSGSFARYVAAIANTIADGSSVGGNPAAFQWVYSGPPINPDAAASTLVDSASAIAQVFAWCNADTNGICRQPLAAASVPGVSLRIGDNMTSPNVIEWATGVSRQLGPRAVARADYTYRSYRDFYVAQVDQTTGIVVDPYGNRADLEIDHNTNALTRRYSGVTLSSTVRVNGRTDVGGNYTLSRLWGNFNGENQSSGPITSGILAYPEYHQDSWFIPEGDLTADQRHRASLWVNYGVPKVNGLTVSLLQDISSGSPYGAAGTVDARPFVPASVAAAYATPQGAATETYYYTARDAFRSDGTKRTDLAVNYTYAINAGSRKIDAFVQAQVLNLFNVQDLCGCGDTVFANGGNLSLERIGQGIVTAGLTRFDPFNVTPVQGVNWNYNANFGTPLNRFAFNTPRMFRMSFGLRF